VSKVTATYSGFVGLDGVPVLLNDGDEYDETHPLVQRRPDLFTEPRRAPGRPPGAKNKPAGTNG
jgi:hypothetical protein